MALLLTEHDVETLLTMPEAIEAVEAAFLRQANGEIINQPRRRLHVPDGVYHTMAAGDVELETFGIKTYAAFAPKARFLMLLYDGRTGDLLAMIEADRLGQIRTGAATGVATRHLANARDTYRIGIYGTGWQARTQLEAVCAAVPVAEIIAYSRTAEKRTAFAETMQEKLGVPVRAADTPEAAARDRDVIITATTAAEPVLQGAWLSPGTHINAVGSNQLSRREVDTETVQRASLIVVDSIEQAKAEAGDLLTPYERRVFRWEQVAELADIVAGNRFGRTDEQQITFFKSVGLALEDVAVATLVYHKAKTQAIGTEVPLWQT